MLSITVVQSGTHPSLGRWHRRATLLGLLMVLGLSEVPSYFARAHEVRQQAEISRLVSDAPSDNRRVNAKPLC